MRALLYTSISAAALMSATAAYAQPVATAATASVSAPSVPAAAEQPNSDQSGADPSSQPDATEIVVTAERRSQSLQTTAAAASVLTGEDLRRRGVNDVNQLQFATPSLTVNQTGQGNSFNIRGIGKTEVTSAVTVGVITYRDGVATLPGYFQGEPYYDIANVEVLRGPQGTFAGGNATGGAVFITENNPELDRVGGYVLGEYGNYNHGRVQGALNLPVSDTVALRFAGNWDRHDTFSTVTGPWTGNPGDRNAWSGRASLLWEPDSHLRVLAKADYNNIEYGGLPAGRITDTGDPLVVANNAFLNGRDEFGRGVLNISYRFDSGLTLRSISGYQRGTTQIDNDADGTAAAGTAAAPAQIFHDKISEEIFSQEFNIISPDSGRFTWLLGAYYQHDEIYIPNGGYVQTNIPGVATILVGTNPKTALAGFGQIGFEIVDGLKIEIGARYSRVTAANDAIARIPAFNLSLAQVDFTAAERLNGKISLNWTVNPNHFLYAFVATGSKAGGLNGPNLAGIQPRLFTPEDVTDFEIGWRGSFANGRIRTHLGAYYNAYEDFQVSIVDPAVATLSSIFNVPDTTKLYGVEFTAQGRLGAFQFDLGASLSKSELGTFFARDPRLGTAPGTVCDPLTGPASARCLNLTGNEQTFAPGFTFNAGAQYAISLGRALGGDATLTPRVDYSHIDQVWSSLFENALLNDRIAARDIVNAQLTLATGPWSIAAYSTNLTDQHYVAAVNGLRRLPGNPREFGVRVSRSF